MQRYADLSGRSGIEAFSYSSDEIIVQFKRGGDQYSYHVDDIGVRHLENMKDFANKGQGLSTYISKNREEVYKNGKKIGSRQMYRP